MPIWGRDATTLATSSESIWWSRLDHTTDTWSDPAAGPIPYDVTGTGAFISAVDVTQFPDTGEIVMVVMTSDSMTPASVSPRIMFVYVSQDDGSTWTLKHRLHMDGPIPDIVLDADGDGDIDDDTAAQDVALERLDSGRLCALLVTEDYTWSLISDDRGASWSPILVDTHGATYQYAGHGCGVGVARNGMACYVRALRYTSDPGKTKMGLWLTRDGVSWSAEVLIPRPSSPYQCCDIACTISPDGWPHIYGTEHASSPDVESALVAQDYLWGRRLKTRDPSLADTDADLVPYGKDGATETWGPAVAFHAGTGLPYGSYAVPASSPYDPTGYDGFVGLDAIVHRGQVVLAVVRQRDGAQPTSDEQPDVASWALMVYRLNAWQPIQERVADMAQDTGTGDFFTPAWPVQGRVYGLTWDCYDEPDSVGWTKTGAVAPSFSYASTDGGYMKINGAPTYYDRTVDGGNVGLAANLRIVVHVESGGDVTTDQVGVRIMLRDSTGRTDFSIRMQRSGANMRIALYDNVNGAQVGSTLTQSAHDWTEILFAQHRGAGASTSVHAYCYARPYHRSTDPDWDEAYDVVADGSITCGAPGGTNTIRFGHIQSGAPITLWKGVHLSRCWAQTSSTAQADEQCALVQAGSTYIDDDAVSDRSTTGTGESPLDDGIDNWMRTCRTLATPPLWTERGSLLSFRGEAVTRGTWTCRTEHDFAARNVTIQPVLREWRGDTDDAETAIVLDAGTVGWRPDSVAVLGHNLAGFTFQFANANNSTAWSSPDVSFQFCMPTLGVTPNRYIHIWSTTSGIDGAGHRIAYTTSSPWRAHQFKSDPGGPTFYFGKLYNTRLHVWKIADNNANTLFMATNTDDAAVSIKGSGVIFSDRFAVMVGHHFDAVDPDVTVVYRYCRIVLRRTRHLDTDAAFPRIGRIVLGQTLEITTQDAEWGWRTGYISGSVLTQQPTGAAYSRRLRPTQRVWEADWPAMLPPPEASAVSSSPVDQPADHTWAWWWDTVRRLDGDGTAACLVWDDGERFVGFEGEEVVQVCSDPLGLAMCHVTAHGTLEHIAYTGVTENLPSGATCVPRPVAAVRSINFTETF